MQTKSIVMVALAGMVAFVLPARADTTIKSEDASVEISVPNGWRQTKITFPGILIQATDGRAILMVRVVSKEDYRDFKSFSKASSTKFIESLTDADPKFEDIQINGKPAIRVSAEGTQSNGLRRGFVMTFLDAGAMYVNVIGIANASTFKAELPIMSDVANHVKVSVTAGPAPATQAPAAVAPPAASPPAAQPPPTRAPR
jgi:hypothetical protein